MTKHDYIWIHRCPLCGVGEEQFRLITAGGERFELERSVMCMNCSLAFLNPRLSPQGLRDYYLSDQFSSDFRPGTKPDSAATEYRDERARRRWKFLKKVIPASARCLEIGCSSGNFLRILKQHGHPVTGIDPSTGYAQFAQESGLTVYVGEFPDDLPVEAGSFDVIASFHVIEHVHDPRLLLRAIRSRLRVGGMVVLEYPDLARAAKRKRLTSEYFQKSHLHDYSLHTMNRLLQSCGLTIEQSFVESEPPLDKNRLLIARAVASGELTPTTPADYRNPAAERAYNMVLRKISPRGYHMWRRFLPMPSSWFRREAG